MLTNGLLGAIRITSAARAPRARPAPARAASAPSKRTRVDLVAVPAPHEPLLERELAGRRLHVRSRRRSPEKRGADAEAPRASRPVTADSGSPRRSASVRTRCSPVSRSPSLNQASPPSSAAVSSAFQRLVAPPPAALGVEDAGERVEHGVEVGRHVEAEHLDVVSDVADHRQVSGSRRLRQREGEARAAEASRE